MPDLVIAKKTIEKSKDEFWLKVLSRDVKGMQDIYGKIQNLYKLIDPANWETFKAEQDFDWAFEAVKPSET